jgi:hypothetical protein
MEEYLKEARLKYGVKSEDKLALMIHACNPTY